MIQYLPLSTFAWLSAAMGLLVLGLPALFVRHKSKHIQIPLALFLLANGVANGLPVWVEFFPKLQLYALAVLLPFYFLQPAALWFYVEGLTSPRPWPWSRRHIKHLLAPAFAIALALLMSFLPSQQLELIYSAADHPLSLYSETLVVLAFAAMVFWVMLTSCYVAAIFLRLRHYRRRLKQLFSNNDQRELYWLNWVLGILVMTWLLSLFYSVPLLSDQPPPLPVDLIAVANFVLLWSLCLWGAQQKPGFEDRYWEAEALGEDGEKFADRSIETIKTVVQEAIEDRAERGTLENKSLEVHSTAGACLANQKYRKSGLGREELQSIAQKIEQAMIERQLYLDSSLSLHKLAAEIQVSGNYLSQTLNEQLQSSFFDYVNGWRIKHAMPQLRNSTKTVLDIAMDAGFNARSSFYKAFKAETGITPSEYRKMQN